MHESNARVSCPLEKTLAVLSGRWKVLIVRELLFGGVKRFGELHRGLSGISQRMLIRELKELQKHGIVARREITAKPLHVEYVLTERGYTLKPILSAMSQWAPDHLGEEPTLEAE